MNIIDFFQHSHLINLTSNIDNFNNVPFNIFQKDLEGRYINCNDIMAISAGFNSKNDIIGLTDLDNKFILKNSLENFKRNDQYVIVSRETRFFTEPVFFNNRSKCVALSQKSPLIVENKIIGSIGFSFIIKQNEIADIVATLLNFSSPTEYNLTKREMDTVKKLLKSQTAKQIASSLGISARTVEQHINNIKIKMGVTRKQEIIEKMISILEE